jgi:hypothetical protein
MRRFLFLLAIGNACALCFLLGGCTSKPRIEKEQAVAIAKREAIRKGWKEVEVNTANFETSRWVITLWELPKTPGGFAIVEVSSNGKVIRFLPGY